MKPSTNFAVAGYGCEDVDPRGFVSLMDMYENNFIRLRKLIPDLAALPVNAVSRLPGCLSLHLTILERSKFTTTLSLTYYFEEAGDTFAEPALTLRVYHDASIVEVECTATIWRKAIQNKVSCAFCKVRFAIKVKVKDVMAAVERAEE